MVEIKNVSVTFKGGQKEVHAVKNASLKIEGGEIYGIVGTSGAGKSTLLRTINLLQNPTNGSILIDGNDITGFRREKLRLLRQSIGMVFQQFNLLYAKTVAENIAFPLHIAGKSKKEIDERVPELLELVGLSEKHSAFPSKLSGGQKQRVGIARALANKPKILLCDEPTSALDLETTNAILDLLSDINRKLGITIIIISHEMAVIKKICSRVAVMSGGSIVENGDAYTIFAEPHHPFTRQLVEHTLDLKLPEKLQGKIHGTLLKIQYRGEKAAEPVLSDTLRNHAVRFNVLHGKIEYINGQPLGVLILDITGEADEIARVISYLKIRTALTEVLHG